jgi:hypothetical protein
MLELWQSGTEAHTAIYIHVTLFVICEIIRGWQSRVYMLDTELWGKYCMYMHILPLIITVINSSEWKTCVWVYIFTNLDMVKRQKELDL